jgi:hypothetical protein
MNHIAVRVGQDLEFDVSRSFQEFLQIHGAIAKGRLRLGAH